MISRVGAYLFKDGDVSRETIDRLDAFAALVTHWTQHINLVSTSSVPHLWDRHILDSAQLYELAGTSWKRWVDLGSGGGFPAIVIAIMATERDPAAQVIMVESHARKATFLRTAIRELALNAIVHATRIESLAPMAADVVSARALTDLSHLIGYALPHLNPQGTALFPKGRRSAEEIQQARRLWRFELKEVPSKTDQDASLLCLREIARA